MSETAPRKENFFLNLILNIFLPVIVLEKLGPRLGEHGPVIALILAVSLPLGYGLYEYIRYKKRNWISLLGLINVLLNGGFGLMDLSGRWFILKEAGFPLILGVAVFISAFSKKPLMSSMFLNEQVMDVGKIRSSVQERGADLGFKKLLRDATLLFSASFFLSAALNYWLAAKIFIEIDPNLAQLERQNLLNSQIAQMTWKSQIAIVLPLMAFSALVLAFFFIKLTKISGMKFEEIMKKPTTN